ncbi:MAG TPA: hypothetical protein VKR61_12510 [Bryobacteraceae bacterium]|nr:hypothetical protein [Bryobacteraceae bacterium]
MFRVHITPSLLLSTRRELSGRHIGNAVALVVRFNVDPLLMERVPLLASRPDGHIAPGWLFNAPVTVKVFVGGENPAVSPDGSTIYLWNDNTLYTLNAKTGVRRSPRQEGDETINVMRVCISGLITALAGGAAAKASDDYAAEDAAAGTGATTVVKIGE